MTASAELERADYFQELSRRAIDQAARLCEAAREAAAASPSAGNPCGDDLDQNDLDLIEAVFYGGCAGLAPWREAQVRELAFWRWVAFRGYDGKDPVMFPLFQEHFMVTTFYRTGWAMAEFRAAAVLELGCGPLGMIEYLPGARRVAFDPLNDKYSRLFANFRSPTIEYLSDRQRLLEDAASFDLGICHNVLDHTDDPAGWFNDLFAKLKIGGRFIFQVNLSKPGLPQSAEHRRMHPSPLGFEQVMGWLAAKSEEFDHFCATEPNGDNEFYFLSWGSKTRDDSVAYRPPSIAKTEAAMLPGEAPKPAHTIGPSARPLTTKFTSAWLSGTTIKGGTEPFANLPPIAELASDTVLQEKARVQFGLTDPIAGYRAGDTAPIPATADREHYSGSDHVAYWLSGLSDALAVAKQSVRLGLGPTPRYFELGCASGRVVRHVAYHTGAQIACCDLNKRHTEWIRLFLPKRINVFHSSTIPNLPIEDNSVDIATAFSVFTHIDDFETAWLLELRRILRPGGLAYLTVSTDQTWEKYKHGWIKDHLTPLAEKINEYTIDEEFFAGPLPREKTVIWWPAAQDLYNSTVFHHEIYIRREWGRIFKVVEIIPNGHFYQDVVLLTKRGDPARPSGVFRRFSTRP